MLQPKMEKSLRCDYHQLPHPGIQSLQPYVPGKSIEALASEQGLTDIIKLASNENPLGCSPLATAAMAKLSATQLASYPAPYHHPLLHKLSKKLGIHEQMLTLGNGSDMLFSVLLTTFALHNNKYMLTHDYAFISYRIQAQSLGIPVLSTALTPNWQVDIDAMIETSHRNTAIIFLANPNNPTGLFIHYKDIQRLLAAILPTTIIVIDEAYYEYAYCAGDKTSLDLLTKYPNLVITRTFSKAYGLAGLRLGYAIANPEITELLRRVQPPFAVNRAALEAANAALDDDNFIEQSVKCNIEGMQQMQQGLRSLKLTFIPSRWNFLTIDYQKDTLLLYQALLQHGIIVRPLHAYGLPNHLRVSIGTHDQNTRFLAKLACEILSK